MTLILLFAIPWAFMFFLGLTLYFSLRWILASIFVYSVVVVLFINMCLSLEMTVHRVLFP